MAVGIVSSGAALVNAGETTVASDVYGGVYVAHVDATNAGAGKTVTGRFVGKVRNTSQPVRLATASVVGVIPDGQPAILTVGPVLTTEPVEFRITNSEAALTSFPWRVSRLGQLAFTAEDDQLAVVGTEHVLDTETIGGVWALVVDLSDMGFGDAVQLRIKTRIQPGDPTRVVQLVTKNAVQADPAVALLSAEVVFDYIQATLKQTAGTGRVFPWKLFRLV